MGRGGEGKRRRGREGKGRGVYGRGSVRGMEGMAKGRVRRR